MRLKEHKRQSKLRSTPMVCCALMMLAFVDGLFGQAIAPDQKPKPLRVPALVEEKSGDIAFDLSAANFSIEDNGLPQIVHLEADADARPVSLCLVIQTGHLASAQADKIARLGDLLGSVLTGPTDQVAVITFGNRPRLALNFAASSDAALPAANSDDSREPGAAVFDALHMAINVLDRVPAANSRVILLISGEHDHGSYAPDAASLTHDILSRNLSIYSLSFSSVRKEALHGLSSMNPLAMGADAMQRNVPQTVSGLTGGDFYHFDSERNFEDDLEKIADHIHNRYNLTFVPSNPGPGLHSLRVDMQGVKANVIAARKGYWISDSNGSNGAPGTK
jgi:hypothetical protein